MDFDDIDAPVDKMKDNLREEVNSDGQALAFFSFRIVFAVNKLVKLGIYSKAWTSMISMPL